MVDKYDPFTKIPLPKKQKNMADPIFQLPDLNYGYYKTTKKYHQINYFCNQAYLESNLINVKSNNIYRITIGGFSCPYTNTYIVLINKTRNCALEKIPYTKLKNFDDEYYNYYPELKVSNGKIDNSNAVNIEFESPDDCESIQVILWLSSNCNIPSKKKVKLRIYLNKLSIEDINNFNTITLLDDIKDSSND